MTASAEPDVQFGAVRRVDQLAAEPNGPASKELMVVTGGRKPKWLRFLCPCGCRDQLALNLMRTSVPNWMATFHRDGTVSVMPSVVSTRCGSHFWIRRNRVVWCLSWPAT